MLAQKYPTKKIEIIQKALLKIQGQIIFGLKGLQLPALVRKYESFIADVIELVQDSNLLEIDSII